MKNGNIIPDFDELKEGFSKRLKDLRVEKTPQGKIILQKNKEPKKTPVEQVAEKTEMSEKMYRKWESGDFLKHLPAGEKLVTMANYHNVSVDYLLGLSDFTTPEKDFIGKEIGLTDEAINKLRQMKREDQTTALQIISDIMTSPDFDKMLIQFMELYTHANHQKQLNDLESVLTHDEAITLIKSLTPTDYAEKSEKSRLVDWYINTMEKEIAAVGNAPQFLKATYADISRLMWNLAESFYRSHAEVPERH